MNEQENRAEETTLSPEISPAAMRKEDASDTSWALPFALGAITTALILSFGRDKK